MRLQPSTRKNRPDMQRFDKKWMAARAWYTAGRMIDWKCPRCGASAVNMADDCIADLADPCPGFARTEEVHQEFEKLQPVLMSETKAG